MIGLQLHQKLPWPKTLTWTDGLTDGCTDERSHRPDNIMPLYYRRWGIKRKSSDDQVLWRRRKGKPMALLYHLRNYINYYHQYYKAMKDAFTSLLLWIRLTNSVYKKKKFLLWHNFIHIDYFSYISLYIAFFSSNWNLR